MIAAKNAEALRVMNEKIRENQISKFYLCLVQGIPKKREATLYAYLRKNSADNMVEVRENPFPGAKKIITGYRVVETRGDRALLEVELVTGRTHQIRAQMAAIGHPLVGDGKYGVNRNEKRDGYKYQALYAYRLQFDRTEGENALSYLEGKSFSLDRSEIWFLNDNQRRSNR